MNLISLQEFLLPLGVAFLCGTILGLERELSHKPAGLRTQTLIALGTTLFVLAGRTLTPEPSRIAASVLTGLGFLGGGVILRQGGTVKGLTTAALIWVNGGLGVVIGLGGYTLAVLGTVITLIALRLLGWIEKKIESKCHVQGYEIVSRESEKVSNLIQEALSHCHFQEKPLSFEKTQDGVKMQFAFCNPPRSHQKFVEKLRKFSEVREIKIQ